jgi:hypothetical protein
MQFHPINEMKKFLLGLALVFLASGCQVFHGKDYNNWGVPENSATGVQWRWAP